MSLAIESYPHIVEQILDYTLAVDPVALRGVSRGYKDQADAVLCSHVAVEFGLKEVPSSSVDGVLGSTAAAASRPIAITGLFGADGQRRVPGLRADGTPAEREACARLLRHTKHVDVLGPGICRRQMPAVGPYHDGDLLGAVRTDLETLRGETYFTPFAARTLILHKEMSTWRDHSLSSEPRIQRVSSRFSMPATLVLNVPGRDPYSGIAAAYQVDAVRLPLQSKVPGSRIKSVIAHVYENSGEPTQRYMDRVLNSLLLVVGQTLTLDWTIVADDNLHVQDPFGLPGDVCDCLREKIRAYAPGQWGGWGDYDNEEDFVDALTARVRIVTRSQYIAEVGAERYWCERGFPPKAEALEPSEAGTKRRRSASPEGAEEVAQKRR
ncbi:uncharacterized protein LOC62_07G008845 [Vanrija pseudolonga]|uniref:Uncharacterized protein n=1 Tax=Vanrija pseudolonga TaxID=143232 RepID=A0AAF0YEN6_9TREE|nr:hypothetical protein LOC62_07G008845 [Vanrija pseudolonga]